MVFRSGGHGFCALPKHVTPPRRVGDSVALGGRRHASYGCRACEALLVLAGLIACRAAEARWEDLAAQTARGRGGVGVGGPGAELASGGCRWLVLGLVPAGFSSRQHGAGADWPLGQR